MQELHDAVAASIQRYIGMRDTEETRKLMVEALNRELDNIPDVEGAAIGCIDLWSEMTFAMRCKWKLANKVFKWIGRDVRSYFDAWRASASDEESVDYSTYPHSWIPVWAVEDPKSVLMTTISLNIPKPINIVKLQVSVTDTANQP